MGTVVVGVEESDRSLDALALARRLACRADALVLVCAYAVDPLMTGEGGAGYARALRAQAEATLARLGGEIGSEAFAVPDRHPAHALARVAAEIGAAVDRRGVEPHGPSAADRAREHGRASARGRALPGRGRAARPSRAGRPADRRRRLRVRRHAGARRRAGGGRGDRAPARGGPARRGGRRVLGGPRRDAGGRPAGRRAARRLRDRPLHDLHRIVAELAPGLDVDAVVVRATRPRSSCAHRPQRTSSSPGRGATVRSTRCCPARCRAG